LKLCKIAALFALAVAGCGARNVTVTPAGTPIQDNFFATWEIDSQVVGPITCEEAGAITVQMDILNLNSRVHVIDSFDCRAYQGTSGPVDVGNFDILLDLLDVSGRLLSQTHVGTENISVAGTIDLGHHIFLVP